MLTMFLLVTVALFSVVIAARKAGAILLSLLLAGATATSLLLPVHGSLVWIFGALALLSLLFSVTPIRRNLVSTPVLGIMRKLLPPISETEQEAIDAGTVWWDGELFTGKPDWDALIDGPKPELSREEQAFIDGSATELCRMVDKWSINHDWNTIPDHIVNFVRSKGFLGMIIPKKYGGLGFSAVAQSQVLLKITNTGGAVTYLVAVPNSLGPGELLLKYGTEEQKEHYLPRLARGQEIPCFALTGPTAGSDATSVPDTGVVCKGEWEGKEVLGMRLNFSKRYITLAPIATLIGLAFRLQDPDGLLGEPKDHGITCALIPRGTTGMEIGRRHMPIGDAFLNGPIKGEDVFVPLDFIIGGPEMAGKGWRMLVNCLSVGRAVTLPTTGAAVGKRALLGTSAYANLRKQFGVAIAKFEGIQKPLARIAGYSYAIDAARLQTIRSIDDGNKPSVPSAILKYHTTEMGRQCLLDAMDIHGGKAVMKGPKNYVADMYESIPVAITVEGANILTRNLMIFGQGAIRSHPYVLQEMQLANSEDSPATQTAFDRVFAAHSGTFISNWTRSLLMGLGVYREGMASNKSNLRPYYRRINRLSAVFAMTADMALLNLGAKLKFRESLSARLGDLLSMLYIASMVMKQHEENANDDAEWPAVEWALDDLLHRYQVAFDELMENWPNRLVATILKRTAFPFGRRFKAPSDRLEKEIAALVGQDNKARDDLTAGVFMEVTPNNPLAYVDAIFREGVALAPLEAKIRDLVKDGPLEKGDRRSLIANAVVNGMITESEAQKLKRFDERLMSVIEVDSFDESEMVRTLNNK